MCVCARTAIDRETEIERERESLISIANQGVWSERARRLLRARTLCTANNGKQHSASSSLPSQFPIDDSSLTYFSLNNYSRHKKEEEEKKLLLLCCMCAQRKKKKNRKKGKKEKRS